MLVLAGTTAVGKTDVSIPLAESLKGEIVNADSRQIYRELEIGTAKPTADQLARVRHHFINEKSIHDRWTAGDFSRAGRERIDQIIGRGNVPVVVGGSMLYLFALLDGFYDETFDESHADYLALRVELEERGGEELYRELQIADPVLAARTNPQDYHRMLRGLAVYRHSGVRLSELQTKPQLPMAHPFILFFLHADRSQTYERVNARAAAMIAEGLVEEVRGLNGQGCNETNCNALRTHGYQEVFPYLRGEISQDVMLENIQKAVRHYVKRQLTWFRRDARTIWVERSYAESAEDVAARIREQFMAGKAWSL